MNYKYFNTLSMLSIMALIISMLFAYRVIALGPFLCPGGVLVFPFIYLCADIVAEVYGYELAKKMIINNMYCILLFNITSSLLLQLPPKQGLEIASSYQDVFGHGIAITIGFAVSFIVSDTINAYCLTKWKILLKGRFYWIRSFTSSVIGEILFSIVATVAIYVNLLILPQDIFKEFFSTVLIKVIMTVILTIPGTIIVAILKQKVAQTRNVVSESEISLLDDKKIEAQAE